MSDEELECDCPPEGLTAWREATFAFVMFGAAGINQRLAL